jgi:hypothetical protein
LNECIEQPKERLKPKPINVAENLHMRVSCEKYGGEDPVKCRRLPSHAEVGVNSLGSRRTAIYKYKLQQPIAQLNPAHHTTK